MLRRCLPDLKGFIGILRVTSRYYRQSLISVAVTELSDPGMFTMNAMPSTWHLNHKKTSTEATISESLPETLTIRLNELPGTPIPDNTRALIFLNETCHDQSVWSNQSSDERHFLTKLFTEWASKVSSELVESGYWCDFVDPASGLLHYNVGYSSNPLLDTDEDFTIFSDALDLVEIGCCRELHHANFGFHVFVGVILTDAPSDQLLQYKF